MPSPGSASSQQQLLGGRSASAVPNQVPVTLQGGAHFRDHSTLSNQDIRINEVIDNKGQLGEQTFYQIEIKNPELQRIADTAQLASKGQLLTRVWNATLTVGIVLGLLACGIGGLAYWITLPKVITQPFLLYGESCYMNSRSCDDTRMLWCPAGVCICRGNFQWNSTAQNCSCGLYQTWSGVECQDYGSYGDPCNSRSCLPTLTCSTVVNQTYSTGQQICDCDNTTYLQTTGSSAGTCVARLSHNSSCLTNRDCQSWLGLSCTNTSGSLLCSCSSTAYWNGSTCASRRLGWQSCSVSQPCETTLGLTCSSGICECDSSSYWDNVTTISCQSKKTYAISCQYSFQCNTTVNLTCPTTSTGCNCPTSSSAYICDCQSTEFWDGQRCVSDHSFNSTCPGQYACTANLVCYLGHCICPGNMQWAVTTPNVCSCATGTSWNNLTNTCI